MYTLEQLQKKTLTELKDIGWQINVLPEGDRRCRRNWIDALVGKNPPLLELLETSPGVEVEPVEDSPPLQELLQNPPGVEVDAVKPRDIDYLDCPRCGTVRGLYATCPGRESVWETLCTHCDYAEPSIRHPFEDVRPFEVDRVKPPIESKFGRIVYPKPASEPIAPTELTEAPNTTQQSPNATQQAPNAGFNDEQPPKRGDGRGGLESEPKLSQSAIGSAAKKSPGVTFSSRFLALYSPPQPGNIHYKSDSNGQLSLLDFEIETEDEPPDRDDFESLDAFLEAIALWDAENLEPLAVSMDSMCEWAPCPADWYEPEAEKLPLKASSMREPTEVSELSPTAKSSDTSEFSIPKFDVWCDRPNRQDESDEPPDTGIFARLPKPKPPNFPLRAIDLHDSCINSAQTQTYCMTAAGSSQSGRSPPGGDAVQS